MRSSVVLVAVLVGTPLVGCTASARPEAPAARPGPSPDAPADESASVRAQRLQEQALQAHARGDFESFTRLTAEALALEDTPARRYNLACGQARLGRRAEALASLRELLELRIDFGAATDPDFEGLGDDPEFVALMAEFEALFPPVHRSRTELVIQPVDLMPEGIVHHAGRTFVSSMIQAAIYELDADGKATRFADVRVDEIPLSTLGLAVDAERELLWAVGTAFEMAAGYEPEHAGTTGVFAFDLQTGAQVEARVWPGKHPTMGFNDLALARDGTVYASGGGLHVARPGQPPALLVDRDTIPFANGLALTPDESVLYAAAGPLGIARVSLPEAEVSWVERPADQYIRGFDGLYYTGGRLVGVQHGQGGPWRAMQLDLDPTGLVVERAHVLEQKHPELILATTAYVDGESMVVLAGRAVPEDRLAEVPASAGQFAAQPVLERVPLVSARLAERQARPDCEPR